MLTYTAIVMLVTCGPFTPIITSLEVLGYLYLLSRRWRQYKSPSPGQQSCCSKMAEAEAAVSVNEKKWFVMHMHVQLKLDEQSCECPHTGIGEERGKKKVGD